MSLFSLHRKSLLSQENMEVRLIIYGKASPEEDNIVKNY